ncbi:hypothetical protein ROZALSC1DRAFT_30746, partial [Rozella allomycis CSF55]
MKERDLKKTRSHHGEMFSVGSIVISDRLPKHEFTLLSCDKYFRTVTFGSLEEKNALCVQEENILADMMNIGLGLGRGWEFFSNQDTLSKNDPPGKFDNSKVDDSMIIDNFHTSENSNEVAPTTFDHVAQNAPSTVPISLQEPVFVDFDISNLFAKFRAAKRTPNAFETLEQETFHKF